MNQYDLTYATASGTYQRLLQTAEGYVYDGLGNTFSFSLNDLSDVLIDSIPSDGQLLSFNSFNNRWQLDTNPLRLIFDFNFGELSYNYTIPYNLKINSFETSSHMTVNLLVNGVTYTLGNLITKFDNFSITVSSEGVLILNGNKF